MCVCIYMCVCEEETECLNRLLLFPLFRPFLFFQPKNFRISYLHVLLFFTVFLLFHCHFTVISFKFLSFIWLYLIPNYLFVCVCFNISFWSALLFFFLLKLTVFFFFEASISFREIWKKKKRKFGVVRTCVIVLTRDTVDTCVCICEYVCVCCFRKRWRSTKSRKRIERNRIVL